MRRIQHLTVIFSSPAASDDFDTRISIKKTQPSREIRCEINLTMRRRQAKHFDAPSSRFCDKCDVSTIRVRVKISNFQCQCTLTLLVTSSAAIIILLIHQHTIEHSRFKCAMASWKLWKQHRKKSMHSAARLDNFQFNCCSIHQLHILLFSSQSTAQRDALNLQNSFAAAALRLH